MVTERKLLSLLVISMPIIVAWISFSNRFPWLCCSWCGDYLSWLQAQLIRLAIDWTLSFPMYRYSKGDHIVQLQCGNIRTCGAHFPVSTCWSTWWPFRSIRMYVWGITAYLGLWHYRMKCDGKQGSKNNIKFCKKTWRVKQLGKNQLFPSSSTVLWHQQAANGGALWRPYWERVPLCRKRTRNSWHLFMCVLTRVTVTLWSCSSNMAPRSMPWMVWDRQVRMRLDFFLLYFILLKHIWWQTRNW